MKINDSIFGEVLERFGFHYIDRNELVVPYTRVNARQGDFKTLAFCDDLTYQCPHLVSIRTTNEESCAVVDTKADVKQEEIERLLFRFWDMSDDDSIYDEDAEELKNDALINKFKDIFGEDLCWIAYEVYENNPEDYPFIGLNRTEWFVPEHEVEAIRNDINYNYEGEDLAEINAEYKKHYAG